MTKGVQEMDGDEQQVARGELAFERARVSKLRITREVGRFHVDGAAVRRGVLARVEQVNALELGRSEQETMFATEQLGVQVVAGVVVVVKRRAHAGSAEPGPDGIESIVRYQ